MENIKGLATGIGSLPYRDADEALDLIFKYCPQIPFWPQLPKRDLREGMLAQFSENLPCLKFTDDGLLFDPKNRDTELEKFYDRLLAEDLDYFKITPDYASGLYRFYQSLNKQDLTEVQFIKAQITGPFTFSASIQDEKAVALLYDNIFMQAISKGLVMKVLWQIKLFQRIGRRTIVFIDEP
ncbi:MAG: hypothetical protein HZC16_00115 [Candidatus Omnitrophica bacterium]|nr:hypothetical protein [Candidatus Omnitrophota bacterium]